MQKITELQGNNNILDIKLDEASRLLKLGQTKETCMKEGRWQNSNQQQQEKKQHMTFSLVANYMPTLRISICKQTYIKV